jgi:hypothetical protein
VADRNPEWLAGHPDIEQRLANARWFTRSCRLWGASSLVVLVAFQSGFWPRSWRGSGPAWELLKDLNSAMLIAGLIYVVICMLLFERWLRANVPLAERRQADLIPRSVDSFVPRWFLYAVYAAVAWHLGAWLVVGVTGRAVVPGFWEMAFFQFVIAGILLSIVRFAVIRRPGAMDRIFGAPYRRIEVRVAFASQLLPLMNGTARLLEQTGYTMPDMADRLLHLGLVAFVATQAVAFALLARRAFGGDQPSPSSTIRTPLWQR